jgi:hypothetical protein
VCNVSVKFEIGLLGLGTSTVHNDNVLTVGSYILQSSFGFLAV